MPSRRSVLRDIAIGSVSVLRPSVLASPFCEYWDVAGAAARSSGSTWSPTDFPELIANGWFQEDAVEGAVGVHMARGVRGFTAQQPLPKNRPLRAGRSGVQFEANSGQHLIFQNESNANIINRWCLLIFRVDARTGASEKATLLNFNVGSAAGQNVPLIEFWKSPPSVRVSFNGLVGDKVTSFAVVPKGDVISDGATWNVLFCYRRNGRLYASLNGGRHSVHPNSSIAIAGSRQGFGRIGDPSPTNPMWAFDVNMVGQSELSEAVVEKFVGWAMWRAGRSHDLPPSHLYRDAPPVVDSDDSPDRYFFDPAAWAAHKANTENKAAKYANRGRPPSAEGDTVIVFHDDFRERSVDRSLGGRKHSIWYAPGFNSSVGDDAHLRYPDESPDCYVHDDAAGTLSLVLQRRSGRWSSGAIYSVNNMGQGRTWQKGIFEIKVRFPKDQYVGGLWPAFWGYNLEHRMWCTGGRVEIDHFEYRGNPTYINGLSVHSHEANIVPGYDGRLVAPGKHSEVAGTNLTSPRNWPETLNLWDGEWHVFSTRIYDDYTYLVVDGLELARIPTCSELRQRIDMQVSLAYTASTGVADPAEKYRMEIDYVQVRQLRSQIEAVSPPFIARPTIAGEPQVGSTLIVDASLPATISDRDYFYYRDGYPIIGQWEPKYVVEPADVGHRIRCMVKAVGATNQPEAWTDETAPVSG